MGTLTFEQLQNEVRFGLGGRTDLNSRLGYIINLAQQRLARIHDYDEMEVISTTTVTNTPDDNDKYLILPNKREVFSIVLLDGSNSQKLTQRTPQFWDLLIPKPEYWTRDRPSDYIIWGNTVELWPLPNATYTLRMRWTQWPVDLVSTTDVSQFNQKDDILIELALVYCFNSLGKEDDAAKHTRILMGLLGEAITMDNTHPDITLTPHSNTNATRLGSFGSSEPWNDPFVRGY